MGTKAYAREPWAYVNYGSERVHEDAKLTAFIANTYLSVCNADLPAGKSAPGGRERRRFWLEKAEEYGPVLDKLGVSGFKNASNKIYSWNEWIAHNRSMSQ